MHFKQYERIQNLQEDKVQIFWEGHKKLKNNSQILWNLLSNVKKSGRFFKFLWPSQNIWTLISRNFDCGGILQSSVISTHEFYPLVTLYFPVCLHNGAFWQDLIRKQKNSIIVSNSQFIKYIVKYRSAHIWFRLK